MRIYELEVRASATKDLAGLPPRQRDRIALRIDGLITDPLPPQSAPLHGQLHGSRRLRVGRYRVGYTINAKAGLIVVWAIGPRESF